MSAPSADSGSGCQEGVTCPEAHYSGVSRPRSRLRNTRHEAQSPADSSGGPRGKRFGRGTVDEFDQRVGDDEPVFRVDADMEPEAPQPFRSGDDELLREQAEWAVAQIEERYGD